jgi:hypothetical protein
MSDFESKLALQVVPGRYKYDGSNEEALRNLGSFLSTSRDAYAKRIGLPSPPPARRKPQQRDIVLDENGRIVP